MNEYFVINQYHYPSGETKSITRKQTYQECLEWLDKNARKGKSYQIHKVFTINQLSFF